jgi:hypothetical protein
LSRKISFVHLLMVITASTCITRNRLFSYFWWVCV